jgi:hypothetical protein
LMGPIEGKRIMRLDQSALHSVAREVLSRGDALRLCVHGSSMAPAIRDGEDLVVLPVDRGRIRLGDVVLCRVGTRLFLHRVVLVGRGGVVVWGDGLASPDGHVGWDEVLGVARGKWREPRPLALRSLPGEWAARARRALRRLVPVGGHP